jgi:hypothetical protein
MMPLQALSKVYLSSIKQSPFFFNFVVKKALCIILLTLQGLYVREVLVREATRLARSRRARACRRCASTEAL